MPAELDAAFVVTAALLGPGLLLVVGTVVYLAVGRPKR